MVKLQLVSLVALLAAASLAAAPATSKGFDKSKHPWAKWKEGSFAKLKMTTEMGEVTQEGTITYTLTKLTEKDYTVTTAVEAGGNTNEDSETDELPTKAGVEVLTVDGKKLECVIWKSKGTRGGAESETRMWVPKGTDSAVKIVTTGGQELKLTAVKLNEEVAAMGKRFKCVRLEGTIGDGASEMKAVMWTSSSVPGGIVKVEMAFEAGEQKGTVTLALVEMKADK